MSPKGGRKSSSVASQETVDLATFLFLADEKKCDITNVTRRANIIKCLYKLRQCGVGPSDQRTKLKTLQQALKMLDTHIPDAGASAHTVPIRCYSAQSQILVARLMTSLCKEDTRKRTRATFDTDHHKVPSFSTALRAQESTVSSLFDQWPHVCHILQT